MLTSDKWDVFLKQRGGNYKLSVITFAMVTNIVNTLNGTFKLIFSVNFNVLIPMKH